MNFRAFLLAGLFLGFVIVAANIAAYSRASSELENALAIQKVMGHFAHGLSNLTIATSEYVVFPRSDHEHEWQDAHNTLQSFLTDNAPLFQHAGISLAGLQTSLDRLAAAYDELVVLRSSSLADTLLNEPVWLPEKGVIVGLLGTHSELYDETLSFNKRAQFAADEALHNHFFTFIAVYASFLVFVAVGIFALYTFVFEPLRSLDHAIENVNQGDLSYRIQAGNPFGFGRVCCAFNDLLDHRVKTERDLEEQARLLSQSNAELENFAYVASHDLKAPLRGITNLVDWITTDLNGGVNETTTRHLDLLKGRAERMDALLDGLLKYSRAGRIQSNFETVDTSRLIQQIGTDLDSRNQFPISTGSKMPSFYAERIPLEQVLRNLISNAIKHHDRSTGRIAIDVEERDEFYEFQVSDDGPGIAQRYHEKVFGMFQTLRPRDEVEGSGMGLSLVKKVVEHHGGMISIESNPEINRGTTFRFTWPKSKEANA